MDSQTSVDASHDVLPAHLRLRRHHREGEGLTPRNLNLLQAVAEMTRRLRGPWLLGGDFNLAPEILRQSGWLDLSTGGIIQPTTVAMALIQNCHRQLQKIDNDEVKLSTEVENAYI